MSFSSHTFEVNPDGNSASFSFHESVGEGQELYFLSRFSSETAEAQTIAESVFGEIVDTFKKGITAPYETFEAALKAANTEANKNRHRIAGVPDIVVAYFDFQNLYLTQCGSSEAYLLRGDTVSQISEPNGGEGDLFNNILSGQVAVDDVVVFSSNRVLRSITSSQFSDLFVRGDFDDSCAQLRHHLMNNSDEDLLVNVIGVGKKSKSGAAGFISKMVSKISREEPIVAATPKPESEPEQKIPEISETPEMLPPSETEVLDSSAKIPEISEKNPGKMLSGMNVSHHFDRVKGVFGGLSRKQKSLALKGLLALVVVVFGVRFVGNFESAATAELRAELQIAKEALQQADTFLLQGDRAQASELLGQAQTSAQKILSAKSKTFRFDAQTLLADIQEKQLAVENAKKVEPQLLADLAVKNDNISALGLLELRGSLFAYDTKNFYKTIRNIVEKGIEVSAKESILAAAVRKDQNTLLFLTDAPRIIESKNGVITPMSTADDAWKKGTEIKTFGRYSYVLDPVENQIWKYERKRSSFSGASAYNQGADLSRAVSFSIDGSIYVLSDDGSIQKLFRGVKSDFNFRDLPSIPFSGKKLKLYTTPELDFLYVLDPENSRILVFNKGDRFATYKKQVLFEGVSDVRDFVVDETGQKANIVTAEKIYELSL